MKHNKEKKKIRESKYRFHRKLTIDCETWYWHDCGRSGPVEIIDPAGNEHRAEKWKMFEKSEPPGPYEYFPPALPGDVRKYIDEHIRNIEPNFDVDPKAIPGKLYAYRETSTSQGPEIRVDDIKGGALLAERKLTKWERLDRLYHHLSSQDPVMLLAAWTDQKKKIAFYKVLIQDLFVTIRIKYPRTWSGSFVETSLEWQQEKHKTNQR